MERQGSTSELFLAAIIRRAAMVHLGNGCVT
jgi:hypothetical protein